MTDGTRGEGELNEKNFETAAALASFKLCVDVRKHFGQEMIKGKKVTEKGELIRLELVFTSSFIYI